MLDNEYKAKKAAIRDKRNYPLTIITAALFLFVTIGIIAIWRYVGHDTYIVLSVILPAIGIDIVLLFAALNGRKAMFKDMYESILNLIVFWP
jgi:hypothetical protein